MRRVHRFFSLAVLFFVVAGCQTAGPRAGAAKKPVELPLVGSDEADPWGLPVKSADKRVLRRLLAERRFDELTRVMEALQDAVDEDCRRELWMMDAVEAFSEPEPSLQVLLDEWIAARPDSFAAHAARGEWWRSVGAERRGGAWARETTREQFRGMADAHAIAFADLTKSLELRPTIAARRVLIYVGITSSLPRDWVETQFRLALEQCPASLQIRTAFIGMSTPRWGGSYEKMEAFAKAAPVDQNRKLEILPGYIDADRCNLARNAGRLEEALEHCDRSLRFGPYWEFAYDRARLLWNLGRQEEAVQAVELAVHHRPQKHRVHVTRAQFLTQLGRPLEAVDSVVLLLELGPENVEVQAARRDLLRMLDSFAAKSLGQRQPQLAEAAAEQSLALGPDARDALHWRASARHALGKADAAKEDWDALMTREPGWLPPYLARAKALRDAGRLKEELEVWARYFEHAKPPHALALEARSNALRALGETVRADEDLAEACRTGLAGIRSRRDNPCRPEPRPQGP